MNRKGFLLVDSLISVVITVCLSLLCACLFKAIDNFNEGYDLYQEEMANEYENIYEYLGECEKCQIEEDSSQVEP